MPGRSLDYPLTAPTAYGNWIFFEFLSRRFGVGVVKSMWSRAAADGVYSTVAISRTLTAAGTGLRAQFAGFAADNLYPARTYAEGRNYRRPPVAATYTLSSSKPGTGSRTTRLNHLAAHSYAFTAGSSLTGSRRVRLSVNGPVRHLRRGRHREPRGRDADGEAGPAQRLGQRLADAAVLAVVGEAGDADPVEHVGALHLRRR